MSNRLSEQRLSLEKLTYNRAISTIFFGWVFLNRVSRLPPLPPPHTPTHTHTHPHTHRSQHLSRSPCADTRARRRAATLEKGKAYFSSKMPAFDVLERRVDAFKAARRSAFGGGRRHCASFRVLRVEACIAPPTHPRTHPCLRPGCMSNVFFQTFLLSYFYTDTDPLSFFLVPHPLSLRLPLALAYYSHSPHAQLQRPYPAKERRRRELSYCGHLTSSNYILYCTRQPTIHPFSCPSSTPPSFLVWSFSVVHFAAPHEQ